MEKEVAALFHHRRAARAVAMVMVAVACWAVPCRAVTLLLGLEPGKSTRTEADRVLGPAVRTAGADVEYAPQGGSGPITVTLREGGSVIDRIRVQMAAPVRREGLIATFKLPETPDATRVIDGRTIAYYGSPNLLIFAHESDAPSSGVVSVDYCSNEHFTAQAAGLSLRAREGQTAAAVTLSNAADAPVILRFNPGACADIYAASSAENSVARRSRNATQRQAILAVMIAAQKGDCANARALFDAYKTQYK